MPSDRADGGNIIQLRDLVRETEGPPTLQMRVETGGGGGNSGGMDGLAARVDAVDRRVERVESRLDKLDDRLRSVETGVSEIKGKLDGLSGQIGQLERTTGQMIAKLPSWWQMPATIGITVAVLTALAGGALWLAMHFGIVIPLPPGPR